MNIQSYGARTHQGPYLEINEDLYDVDFDVELFMVIDGFGGSGNGDVFVSELRNLVKHNIKEFVKDKNATLPFYYSDQYLLEGNILINSIISANKTLYEDNLKREFQVRGGASGIFLIKSESVLTLISIGNCVGYLFRQGNLEKLFIEDSFKFLTNDDYNNHLRTTPISVFGMYPNINYQIKELRAHSEDKILLMTDGVYSRINDNEIIQVMSNSSINSGEKIQKLISLSNIKGNLDNQTSLILEF